MSHFQYKITLSILSVIFCLSLLECNRKEGLKAIENPLDSLKQNRNINSPSDDIKTIETIADLFYNLNDYKPALEHYDKLIRIDSTNGLYYYRKGQCLIELDKYKESITNFSKSADLDYNIFESYRAIGFTYALILNDNEKAILYFEKCLRIKPDDDEINTFLQKLSNNSSSNKLNNEKSI